MVSFTGFIPKIGEFAALGTAVSWTAGAMVFESASRRAGVMAVNTLKVIFATLYLGVLSFIVYRRFLPAGLPPNCWIFMSASGIVGFVIGDYFLFNAYLLIGSRMGMLLMSASVPLTAVASRFFFGEALGKWSILGIVLAMAGISLTVIAGKPDAEAGKTDRDKAPFRREHYRKGIVFGIFSAVAMAAGTILTKTGAAGVSAIGATQVRVFAAAVGFIVLAFLTGKSDEVISSVRDPRSLRLIAIGSVFGPFAGVGCLLFALQKAPAGIVSTISSLSPVLIIAPSILIWKRKVGFPEILGALIAFGGTALLFL